MARALWKGSISFGLVSIPVGLVTVTESQGLDLDMIDERDHARIKYKRVNAKTGKEVPYEKIVKGYEYTKGKYVIIDEKDFKRANPKASQTIDIEAFVDIDDVDITYFDKPYLLEPLKGGDKAYTLLRETLKKTGKVGIARVVIRTKQYLSAVVPRGDLLYLELLRFPHELRDPQDLKVAGPHSKVSAAEVKMAQQLVASMDAEWDPEAYKDTYRDDMMKLIEKKAEQGDLADVEDVEAGSAVERPSGRVLDLMPLLKQSLAEGRRESSRRASPARKKRLTVRKKAVKRGA